MTFQPGHTKTGGRKRGVTNKRTERYQAEVTKSGLKPVDYLLTVMRDKRNGRSFLVRPPSAAALVRGAARRSKGVIELRLLPL